MSEADLNSIFLRYHEVALKGGNRPLFERKLAENAVHLLASELGLTTKPSFELLHGRILLKAPWNEASRSTLRRVFGVSSFSPLYPCTTDFDAINAKAITAVEAWISLNGRPASFRVDARRSDKVLAKSSVEINEQVGSAILEKFGPITVNLSDPELTLGIEIRARNSFVWTEKVAGPGGLPVGANGRTLVLLSGGIDSPVAAIQTLKRGALVDFIHFDGRPFVGEETLLKVKDLVHAIARYTPRKPRLLVVPFGKTQEAIALKSGSKLRTVLYRRMMMRIASRAARDIGALALVTGENLGQVASQTLENLTTIDCAATIPILRPLITWDKEEIIQAAKKFGTFTISIRPAEDCCTLFADRHPATQARLDDLTAAEERYFPNKIAEEISIDLIQDF